MTQVFDFIICHGNKPFATKQFITNIALFCWMMIVLTSCYSQKLTVSKVAYQSVHTAHAQPTKETPIPNEAKIVVVYSISEDGDLTAIVNNRTSQIMIIDQTMSFFINSTGTSTSYYDPTVRTTSQTDVLSRTNGASVNLGAIANAFGIGGIAGSLLGGISVGGAGTRGQEITNTTYVADQPKVSLAPRSSGAMSKVFRITGLTKGNAFREKNNIAQLGLTADDTYCKFSVCISYSLDGGETYEKIVTDFYANSRIIMPVAGKGRVNDALRRIYSSKADALHEYWWMLYFPNNITSFKHNVYDTRVQGVLYDYQ